MASFAHSPSEIPDIQAIRQDAILAGGADPISMRFRIIEYEKTSGERLGVPVEDIGFRDAIAATLELIENSDNSHFCLEPVGYLQ